MNQSLNSQQMRFYAGTAWEELQREADRISHHYAGNKRLSEADRITFIEESSRLCGGIEAVQSIVPRVRLRHREWLEHALANLLSGIQRLEGITTIDMEQRPDPSGSAGHCGAHGCGRRTAGRTEHPRARAAG